MKNALLFLFLTLFLTSHAQENHWRDNSTYALREDWKPFYHGVASGDPLENSVLIWTRVTPDDLNQQVNGEWFISSDHQLLNVIQSGTFTTDQSKDFTVKVSVDGLDSDNTYYYAFKVGEQYSLIGRTKTLAQNSDHLKFAVVSCSNYQAGFFNGYQGISRRNDLDAVIHLGDYIYEYEDGAYGNSDLFEERKLDPETEILDLEDYRVRYSTYRLDTQLIRLHQQHPIIAIWDDHESANDSYEDGAQNHTEGEEGSWEDRKQVSKQAYFEWLPIRDNAQNSVYRTFSYGDIAHLVMIDTRLEGRNQQINDVTNPALYDPNRTLLGEEQKSWFLNELSNYNARWKIIGNQVVFSEFNVGWAADSSQGQSYVDLENIFMDIWDGYPSERDQIIDYISDNQINNVVWLTGDFHSTFAFDVAKRPSALPFAVGLSQDPPTYDGNTQAGSVAVEFATPSITSANFDENVGAGVSQILEYQINRPLAGVNINPNPHMRFVDLDRHGYFILDITKERAQADYFYNAIDEVTDEENFETGMFTNLDENKLNTSTSSSAAKDLQDTPAPPNPPFSTANTEASPIQIFNMYPNPVKDELTIYFGNRNAYEELQIRIINAEGKTQQEILIGSLNSGLYTKTIDVHSLKTGSYFLQILNQEGILNSQKISVTK